MSQLTEDKARQLLNDIETLLKLPAGRRLFLVMLEQANVLGISYAAGDPTQTAYNEGVRAVGLWLKTLIEAASPGAFPRLLLESLNLPEKLKSTRRK